MTLYASCRVLLINCLVVVGVIRIVHQFLDIALSSTHNRIGSIGSVITNKRKTDQWTHIRHSFTVEELQGLIKVGDTFVRDPKRLTIVCQLSGELGNNIGKFVHSLVLWMKLTQQQQQLQPLPKRPNANFSNVPTYNFHIALRHAPYRTWVRGHHDAKQCFSSSLGRFDFSEAYNSHYDDQLVEQNERHWTELLAGINIAPQAVQEALDNFIRIATAVRQSSEDKKESTVTSTVSKNSDAPEEADSPISLPFLRTDAMVGFPDFAEFVDEYYYEIRQFLQFNMEACCALLPDPDESVFVSGISRYC
jgi:hypothetical protein